jgi:PKHD-type hydroxylase
VSGGFDQSVRQSSLAWLPESDELAWVGARMARLAGDANRELFGFALDGFDEQFQLAEYGPGNSYDWHIDRGQGKIAGRRKLTLSVQLTEPALYDGGALEINADGHPFQVPRNQGTAVVFSATTLHRVEPVVRGLRHSLVTWTHGPAFV